jgi:chromosome partitioning protein
LTRLRGGPTFRQLMKVLVVASPKGGVGKTTLTLQLAHAFVQRNVRVLVVDADPQGAIGLSLSKSLNEAPGLASYMAEGRNLSDVMIKTRVDGFHLLPMGRIGPHEVEAFGSAMSSGQRFKHLFGQAELDHDLVIVDTPCGFTGVTVGALRAGSHVISPIQAEPIALRAITQLLEMVQVLRSEGSPIEMAGFVLTMLQVRDEHSFDVARELWDRFPADLLFDANIPRDPVFLEATAKGVPVGFLRRPAPPVTHVFGLIAAELEQRMGLTEVKTSDEPQPFLV